ncbi:MAG TPA: hypothetical protein VKW08_00480 [Xanthobacteraceae bacterium]|jgi:hypothetical protein|nr:hypothetical protein [Xanthobacteraceae bacterium]
MRSLALFLLLSTSAFAGSWYDEQTLTPETQKRLNVGWNSCCLGSEVVKTQFRVNKTDYGDEWYYLKDGAWRRVPPDIVHGDEHAPNGQATLFIYFVTGQETCFFRPQEGG